MFQCHDVANEISKIKDTNKNTFETSSKKEITHFLKLHEELISVKKGSNPYLSYDIDKLKLEEITNTDAKLTVIDAKNTNHYSIGCNAIGQFKSTRSNAFNIQNGDLSTLCNQIR